MEEKTVLVEKKDKIAWLTLNRPQVFNAMSPELFRQLLAALQDCEEDPEINVLVLTGAGKAFCAGGDLPTLDSVDNVVEARNYIATAGKLASTISNLQKPVIAMVNGVAAGAGFNMALACDLVICTATARFIQSFVSIGLVPDCGGTYFLPRLVGLQKAKELMLLAAPVDAQGALQLGIVNRVVEEEKLREAVMEYAEKLAKSAPLAVRMIKKNLNQSLGLTLENVLELESDIQTILLQTADNQEGIAAFREKRQPIFRGC